MNDKQKIFVMVGVGSVAVFLITVFFLGFDGGLELYIYASDGNTKQYIPRAGVKYLFTMPEKSIQDIAINYDYWERGLDFKTNYLGIIAVFNIVISLTGFFLFKDK